MQRRLITLIMILSSLFNLSCSNPEDTPPETKENTPPFILSLTADPSSIAPEGTSTITCEAADNESDILNFNWNTSAGSIDGTGSSVIYTAPPEKGISTVTCFVDDGIDSTSWSVEVNNYNWVTASVADIDGNVYRTITIGDQEWMAENLVVTRYRDSTEIQTVYGGYDWMNLDETETGAYVAYEHNASGRYGYLYNWYAVANNRILAPEGWRVPTDDDWKELEMNLGMSQMDVDDNDFRGTNEGSKLAGNSVSAEWSMNELRNNVDFGTSGFLALPGGKRDASGNFGNEGGTCYFWTGTPHQSGNYNYAWSRELSQINSGIRRLTGYRMGGYSVRCVKD
ncbi:fibrobacter succinogenes major paralogous domain-containing protein [bacterium]|nr:fibrobacter succinogenes major paralogous domain-containing protein [bacterium]